MLSLHILCENTYAQRLAGWWLSLRVEPGAGLPEGASRAMASPGIFSEGGAVAMDGAASVSDGSCPAPLSASENAL